MDIHSSGSAEPSHTHGGYSLDSVTIVAELCLAVMALQKAAVDDCPETFSDSNAQVRFYVQRLLEIKSDSQTYMKVREAVLNLLEAALGEEHEYFGAVLRNLDTLPDRAVGDEEADPPL